MSNGVVCGTTVPGRGFWCHKQTGSREREREEAERDCCGVQMDDGKCLNLKQLESSAWA